MATYAITVVGEDRPGIIASVTEALAELGANLEDSSMTLLRGHFAMTLVTAVDASLDALRERLTFLENNDLSVSIRAVGGENLPSDSATHVVRVHGGDRPGIVSAVTSTIAAHHGNVVDLTTRLVGGLYIVVAEIFLPADAHSDDLAQALGATGSDLGVDVRIEAIEVDEL